MNPLTLVPPENLAAYGELRGFLDAMAWVNTKSDHGYTFSFDAIRSAAEPTDTIETALNAIPIRFSAVRLEPVPNWRVDIRLTMLAWLLEFQNPRELHHLLDQHKSFSLSHEFIHDMFMERPLKSLEELVENCTVWKIEAVPEGFFDIQEEDFLFHSPEVSYWLHFGWMD